MKTLCESSYLIATFPAAVDPDKSPGPAPARDHSQHYFVNLYSTQKPNLLAYSLFKCSKFWQQLALLARYIS